MSQPAKRPDFGRFFNDYAAAFNRSLGDGVDTEAIAAAFAPCCVDASPSGVNCGKNDASFKTSLEKGYAFYKQIGTKRMTVRRTEAQPIDPLHDQVRVSWRAQYERPSDGEPVTIDFQLVYLLQTLPGETPKIFAFIAGDEMAEYKKHGLLPEDAEANAN